MQSPPPPPPVRFAFHRAAILALAALLPAGPQSAPTTAGFERYSFDEPVPLDLDRGVVGVRFAGLTPQPLPASFADLRVESLPIPGWCLLRLPAPAQNDEQIQALLSRLAALPDLDFVTPVFRGATGGPVLPTPVLLVQFDASLTSADVRAILSASGPLTILEEEWAGMPRAYRLHCATGSGSEALALANALARRADVRFAEPDFIFTGSGEQSSPNDPMFDWSWGLQSTGAYYDADFDMDVLHAWERTRGDPSVRVAIIDTGVDPFHADLNQDPGADFTGQGGGGAPVNSCDNHGTKVAGCVSMRVDNGIGSAGAAPECKVVSLRTFISNLACDNGWTTQSSWTVDALSWAAAQGIQVTNNSNIYGTTSSAIDAMYQQTRDVNGMIHFASAGNSGARGVAYPALLPSVNAIGASSYVGRRAGFSSWGPELDFLAPGYLILTTDRSGADGTENDEHTYENGTSFASPYAAAIAALMLSLDPGLAPATIEKYLRWSARDLGAVGPDEFSGAGMIQAARAVAWVPHNRAASVTSGSPPPDRSVRTCDWPAMSEDGRYLAFTSDSAFLVPGDTNGKRDVFLLDRQSGVTTRISVGPSGAESNNESRRVSTSEDGRYVVYESWASNLVAGDSNGSRDAFVYDRVLGTTSLVGVSSGGARSNREAAWPVISADGRWIAFHSNSTNLDPLAVSGSWQIYLRDTLNGVTKMVSKGVNGLAGNGDALFPAISDDGQTVAFVGFGSNYLPVDANGFWSDVLVYHHGSGTIEFAGVDAAGAQASEWTDAPEISGDGTRVSFVTEVGLDPADVNGVTDVYVRDLASGTTVAASTDGFGAFGASSSLTPAVLSFDGRYVAFPSANSTFVPGDDNGCVDVFRKDLLTGAVVRCSVGASGAQSSAGSGRPFITDDGSVVGFSCRDDLLIPGDRQDGFSDLFLHFLATAATVLLTPGS